MGHVRATEETIQKRRDQISRLKLEISDHEVIAGQKDSILWKRIGPRIDAAIEANREKIEAILAGGPVRRNDEGHFETVDPMADFCAIKTLGGAIAFAKVLKQEVEVEGVIERKRQRVFELTEELKKIEAEQGE